MKSLSLILPIHNCANKLRNNVQLLVELLPNLTSEFQLIIVDDGSDDGSDDILSALADHYPQIAAVYHGNFRGEKAAIQSGMKLARNDLTFIQATDEIEENKIRGFLKQDGLTQRVTTIETEPLAENSIPENPKQVSNQVCEELDQQAVEVRLENRLVERLMQWGTALREYQQQSVPARVFQRHDVEAFERRIDRVDEPEVFQAVATPQESSVQPSIEQPSIEQPSIEQTDIDPPEERQQEVTPNDWELDLETPESDVIESDFDETDTDSQSTSLEIDSFVDASFPPDPSGSSQKISNDLSSLYASSALLVVGEELSNEELPNPDDNRSSMQANRPKISPPKYSSIPELRLTRLSQSDLSRKAQSFA